MKQYDKIVLGAGIFGLYATLLAAKQGDKVCLCEYEAEPMKRASFINQARVHNGYHYPRSYSTAIKSVHYYDRFLKDYSFAINKQFKKIYAIAENYSWTNAKQFEDFCRATNTRCKQVIMDDIFNKNFIEAAYETEEFAFDAKRIRDYFLRELEKYKDQITINYNFRILSTERKSNRYSIEHEGGKVEAEFILNATYASLNQILERFEFSELFHIKYEICEIILCDVDEKLKNLGLTVMDGPFFSLMPFGIDGYHSLSAVQYTPHRSHYGDLPRFNCQKGVNCSPKQLENCNECPHKPESAWVQMSRLAKKFLVDGIELEKKESLFAIKALLLQSEIDDSRPTLIKKMSNTPHFYSILSGKVNALYDIEELIKEY